jgi:hypothetical protein
MFPGVISGGAGRKFLRTSGFFLASGLGVKLKKAEKVNQNKYQLR